MDPPTTPSLSTVPPEFTILGNSPALHSLKRQQLIQLCKQFNLKANGKNVELIERLKQHGKDLSPALARDRSVDGSNTSWDLVSNTDVPDQNDLKEFGFNQSSNVGLSTSGSNSSLASTIKSAGTAVLKKFTQPSHRPATSSASSIYPSLQEAFEKYPLSPPENGEKKEREEEEDQNKTLEDFDHSVEGAIRRVTTHTTANTSIGTASLASPLRPPITPSTFVFGSPISQQTPQSSFNFELSMPGSLLSLSTNSLIRDGGVAGDERGGNGMRGTQVSILEEMNRRALESRKEAEKSGISLAKTLERGSVLASNGRSPEKRKKEEEFDGKHKRVFDKMDSITNHYAAKRPHPSHNSSSTLAKSSSSKTFNSSSNERPTKRIKPSFATGSTSSRNLVSALRDSGWSSEAVSSKETTSKVEKVSLKNSIRGVANSLSGGSLKSSTALDSFREEREKEREMRKRKLELAKARRKSGAQGTQKRRSTVVGPKHAGSVSSKASSLLKSTFKRLTTSSSIVTPARPSETPRFAIPTASSSSRAGLVSSSSVRSNLVSSTSTRTLSSSAIDPASSNLPKKKKGEPGWKKFDLQESLKRPMTWKTHLTASSSLSSKPSTLSRSKSNASLLSPPPLSRQVSARVANPALLAAERSPSTSNSTLPSTSTSTSVSNDRSIAEKLASLPSAPTQPFSNLSNNSVKSKGAAITQSRKLVSSTTKKARSGKSQMTTTKIEGLETKARKIRAVRKGGPFSGK